MADTIQLGSPFQRNTPDYSALTELITGLKASVINDIRVEANQAVLDEVRRVLGQWDPTVQVAAPSVTVTPNLMFPENHEVEEVEAMDRQTAILIQINERLGTMISMMARPVVREVERDHNGQIIRVTESR